MVPVDKNIPPVRGRHVCVCVRIGHAENDGYFF